MIDSHVVPQQTQSKDQAENSFQIKKAESDKEDEDILDFKESNEIQKSTILQKNQETPRKSTSRKSS